MAEAQAASKAAAAASHRASPKVSIQPVHHGKSASQTSGKAAAAKQFQAGGAATGAANLTNLASKNFTPDLSHLTPVNVVIEKISILPMKQMLTCFVHVI